jgi:hypothetical protein
LSMKNLMLFLCLCVTNPYLHGQTIKHQPYDRVTNTYNYTYANDDTLAVKKMGDFTLVITGIVGGSGNYTMVTHYNGQKDTVYTTMIEGKYPSQIHKDHKYHHVMIYDTNKFVLLLESLSGNIIYLLSLWNGEEWKLTFTQCLGWNNNISRSNSKRPRAIIKVLDYNKLKMWNFRKPIESDPGFNPNEKEEDRKSKLMIDLFEFDVDTKTMKRTVVKE